MTRIWLVARLMACAVEFVHVYTGVVMENSMLAIMCGYAPCKQHF